MGNSMSSEDILIWADGTWCFRHELSEMNHMSDDYSTIPVNSPHYDDFIEQDGS